ncbi:MAG: hypothetical protein ACR2JW_14300 [Thermomicrobiales bacterium]
MSESNEISAAERLNAEYGPRGLILAGRLQLPKDDALEFADCLRAIGVGVYGLELWYYSDAHPGKAIEFPWSPDYSKWTSDPNFPTKSIDAAKAYIIGDMPSYISLIGFVF